MEKETKKFKVALFDMDGVLYDSMKNHAICWHEAMASYGINMTEEEAYLYEGMKGPDTIRLVAQRQWGRDVSYDEAKEMYRRKSDLFKEKSQSNPPMLIPGVKELQKAMRAAGIRIGVVTGSGQSSLLERIKTDFEGLVSPDIFVTALNISHGKPHPDPYLRGMEMAGSQPNETIVVENAPLGIKAGKAAGCFTVAVNTGPLPDDILQEAHPDGLFHTMDELKQALFH